MLARGHMRYQIIEGYQMLSQTLAISSPFY